MGKGDTLLKIGNIGINGFGRIGRLFLRQCLMQKLPVVALNDPNVSPQYVAYMLKYDSSSQGPFKKKIALDGNHLVLGDQCITLSFEKDPKAINWGKKGVDAVVDCSGQFATMEKASQHLQDRVSRVFISTPSKDIPMFLPGVNLDQYKLGTKVLSTGSCTTSCLAVLAKVVHEKFKILEGVVTTVQASSQPSADNANTTAWRTKRNAIANIIPTTNNAINIVGQLIPDLKGKLMGMALCVPLPPVSLIDLTCRLGKPTKLDDIKAAFKEASQSDMKDILAFVDDEVVSSDFLGSKFAAAFDARACIQMSDTFVKLIAWYDNESGCASQLLRLVKHCQKIEKATEKGGEGVTGKEAEKQLTQKYGEFAEQIKSVQEKLDQQYTELHGKCAEKEKIAKYIEKAEKVEKVEKAENAEKAEKMEMAEKAEEERAEFEEAEEGEEKVIGTKYEEEVVATKLEEKVVTAKLEEKVVTAKLKGGVAATKGTEKKEEKK